MDEPLKEPVDGSRPPDVVTSPPPERGLMADLGPDPSPRAQVQPYEPQTFQPPPVPAQYLPHQEPAYPPGYAQHQAATAALLVGRRSAAVPGVLSFFFPGVGQLINGAPVAGVLFLLAWLVNLPFVLFFGILVVPWLVDLAIGVFACVHAVRGVNRHNERLVARALGGPTAP